MSTIIIVYRDRDGVERTARAVAGGPVEIPAGSTFVGIGFDVEQEAPAPDCPLVS